MLGRSSVDELRRWVQALDPPRAHLGRTQLLRAVEIALLTGERLSDLHRDRRAVPALARRAILWWIRVRRWPTASPRGSTTCSTTGGQTRCEG